MEEVERSEEQVSGVKPWLLWAGGKRGLASKLVAEITKVRPTLYIEPFLGGGAVALALPIDLHKILADVNQHLIDCWLCMQKMPGNLLAELREVERVHGDTKEGYLAARSEFNTMINHPRTMWARRSALLIYLNARCFNGLWRTNSRGCFNVPFGKRVHPRKIEVEDLEGYTKALCRCRLLSNSFVNVLGVEFTKQANKVRGKFDDMRTMLRGVAVYADPPYDGTFNGYTEGGFGTSDQRTLGILLSSFVAAGAAVWATNADTPLIREIYRWAQIEEVDETHVVGSKPERRGKRKCLLIRGGAAIR